MEIHSSSLASIPSGYSPKNRNDPSQLSDSNRENKAESSTVSSPANTKAVDTKFDIPKLQLISDDIEQQQKPPTNSRTAHAVNAYAQESSQALRNQRSELVSGIDFFA